MNERAVETKKPGDLAILDKESQLATGLADVEITNRFLTEVGLSSDDQGAMVNFFRTASPQELAQLQERIVGRLGQAHLDGDKEVKEKVESYLQTTAELVKTTLADKTQASIRDLMTQTKGDLAVLVSCLMFPETEDSQARVRFWRIMVSSLYAAARQQGLSVGGLEEEDRRSAWIGQRYPLLAAPADDRRLPLIKIMAEEITFIQKEQIEEEAIKFSPPPIEKIHSALRGSAVRMVESWQDRLEEAPVAIDFEELGKRSQYRPKEKIEVPREQLITAAVQQFHPTEGKYWQIENPVEATRRLNSFVQMIEGVQHLPEELLQMLSFAALAPDRGLVIGDHAPRIMTLVVTCPRELRPLKEAVIFHQLEQELQRDLNQEVEDEVALWKEKPWYFKHSTEAKTEPEFRAWSQRRHELGAIRKAETLLLAGLVPPPGDVYFNWFLEKVDQFSPENPEAPWGGFDFLDLLLTGETKLDGLPIYSNLDHLWPPQEWRGFVFSDTVGVNRVPFLTQSEERSRLFFEKALDCIHRAPDKETKARRYAGLTDTLKMGMVMNGEMRLVLLEEALSFSPDQEFRRTPELGLWFGFKARDWYKRDPESVWDRLDHEAIRESLKEIRFSLAEKAKITDKLLTGVDMGAIVAARFDRLRKDEKYKEWEAQARQGVFALLKEISAEEKEPPPRVSLYSVHEGGWQYQDWVNEGIGFSLYGERDHFVSMRNETLLMALEKHQGELSPVDLGKAEELVDQQINPNLIRQILLYSKQGGLCYYAMPFQAKDLGNTYLLDALRSLEKEQAADLIAALGQWEESLAQFENLKLFQLVVDFDKARQELAELKVVYQSLVDVEDRKQWHWPYQEAPEFQKLLEISLYLKGITYRKNQVGCQIIRQPQRLAVQDGQSPRLVAVKEQFRRRTYPFPEVVPASIDVPAGTCVAVTGPTGAGKSVYLEAIMYNLIYADTQVSLAKRVVLPGSQEEFVYPHVAMVGFEKKDRPGESTFMESAKQEAEAQKRSLAFMDEPGGGAPTGLRMDIVGADIIERIYRGENVGVATHQGIDLAEIFHLLGWEDRFLPVFITPDERHEVHRGIGGSFGLEMLRMQGCSGQLVRICRDFMMAVGRMPEGSLSLQRRELPAVQTEGLSATARSLENARFSPEDSDDNVLSYFVYRAGGSKPEVKRMYQHVQETCNNDPKPGIELMDQLEKIPLADHQALVQEIIWLNRLVDALSQPVDQESLDRVLKDCSDKPTEFARFYNFDPVSPFQDEERRRGLQLVIEKFSPDVKERAQVIVEQLARASKAIDTALNQEAFVKVLSREFGFSRKDSINAIETTLKKDHRLNEEWRALIKVAREGNEAENYQPVMVLFDRFVRTYPYLLSEIYSADRGVIVKSLAAAKERSWEQLFASEKKAESDIIGLAQEFAQIADNQLDLLVFASFYSLSSRPDNQEIPFCVPEIGEVDKMPFPQQIFKGWNVSLARAIGPKKYIPQTVFCKLDGTPMELEDLPTQKGKFAKEPIGILALTGVHGEGKSETLRQISQNEIHRRVANRVPAKYARMAPEPPAIVCMIEPAQTKGIMSTFSEESARVAETESQLRPGVMVFYDDPGAGTVKEEKVGIINVLGYVIKRKGGWYVFATPETAAYDGWDLLTEEEKVYWYPLAYEFTREETKRRQLKHGIVGGAETFTIAEEQGMSPKTIELARLLNRRRQELREFQKRLL